MDLNLKLVFESVGYEKGFPDKFWCVVYKGMTMTIDATVYIVFIRLSIAPFSYITSGRMARIFSYSLNVMLRFLKCVGILLSAWHTTTASPKPTYPSTHTLTPRACVCLTMLHSHKCISHKLFFHLKNLLSKIETSRGS